MTMLTITELAGGYPGTRVLDGVHLRIEQGQVLGLLGRNGVGKTTLVHTVMGMLTGRGSIRFEDHEICGLPTHTIARRGIALVPQGRRIFGPLTVDENLKLSFRGKKSATWTPDEVYALFPRLLERRKNRGDQLSGGEQEMLSIGRALVTNPRFLLMDEPSDGLAPSIVELVGATIRRLAESGVTVLLVEQNLSLAFGTCDEIAVMSKGRVTYTGSARSLRDDAALVGRLLGVTK